MLLMALSGLLMACTDTSDGPLSVAPDRARAAAVANAVAALSTLRTFTVAVNGTTTLTTTLTPTTTTVKTSRRSRSTYTTPITWKSSDITVATVDATGKVTGKANGGAVVTAAVGTAVDSMVVKVGTGPGRLAFPADSQIFVGAGQTKTITATGSKYPVIYFTENASVAAVTGTGATTSTGVGRTYVVATNIVGAEASYVARVVDAAPVAAALAYDADSVVLTVGTSITKVPSGASSTVTYASRNTGVATVSSAGLIVGAAAGRTVVAASSTANGSDSIAVIVKTTAGIDPTPLPTPPTSGDTISAAVRRRATGTGSVLVSNALPLRPGALAPGASNRVHVYVNGVEQRVYVEELAGRHKDGTLRSVLIQFPYAVELNAPQAARVIIGTTARTLADLSKPADNRGDPAAVMLPTDPAYLVTTDIVGPTVTSAEASLQIATYGRQYDTDFSKFADMLYQTSGDLWTENYYDRAQAYWAEWARTGNPVFWDRATRLLLAYRRDYLEANSYGSSPHWAQIDGLGIHYWLTGDEASRYAIQRLVPVFNYFRNTVGLSLKNFGDIDNRIRARVMMASLWAWRTSDSPSQYTPDMDKMLNDVLGAQEADGSYKFTFICNASLNYMDGMLNEALIQYYTHYKADARIIPSVQKNVNWLWSQWNATSEGFTYTPNMCGTIGGTEIVPELNNLIVNGYAWVYARTGDLVARNRADAIFAGSVKHSFLYGSKQFNQQYSVGYRYFAYRNGK